VPEPHFLALKELLHCVNRNVSPYLVSAYIGEAFNCCAMLSKQNVFPVSFSNETAKTKASLWEYRGKNSKFIK
jgi:hypothetical protein